MSTIIALVITILVALVVLGPTIARIVFSPSGPHKAHLLNDQVKK